MQTGPFQKLRRPSPPPPSPSSVHGFSSPPLLSPPVSSLAKNRRRPPLRRSSPPTASPRPQRNPSTASVSFLAAASPPLPLHGFFSRPPPWPRSSPPVSFLLRRHPSSQPTPPGCLARRRPPSCSLYHHRCQPLSPWPPPPLRASPPLSSLPSPSLRRLRFLLTVAAAAALPCIFYRRLQPFVVVVLCCRRGLTVDLLPCLRSPPLPQLPVIVAAFPKSLCPVVLPPWWLATAGGIDTFVKAWCLAAVIWSWGPFTQRKDAKLLCSAENGWAFENSNEPGGSWPNELDTPWAIWVNGLGCWLV